MPKVILFIAINALVYVLLMIVIPFIVQLSNNKKSGGDKVEKQAITQFERILLREHAYLPVCKYRELLVRGRFAEERKPPRPESVSYQHRHSHGMAGYFEI